MSRRIFALNSEKWEFDNPRFFWPAASNQQHYEPSAHGGFWRSVLNRVRRLLEEGKMPPSSLNIDEAKLGDESYPF